MTLTLSVTQASVRREGKLTWMLWDSLVTLVRKIKSKYKRSEPGTSVTTD